MVGLTYLETRVSDPMLDKTLKFCVRYKVMSLRKAWTTEKQDVYDPDWDYNNSYRFWIGVREVIRLLKADIRPRDGWDILFPCVWGMAHQFCVDADAELMPPEAAYVRHDTAIRFTEALRDSISNSVTDHCAIFSPTVRNYSGMVPKKRPQSFFTTVLYDPSRGSETNTSKLRKRRK